VELDASPLRTGIERLAERARVPLSHPDEVESPTRSSIASDLGLTQREVEVPGHLAAVRTDRQIAETLFISKKTVSVHVSSLFRKLDVANRVDAGAIGQRHGLRWNPAGVATGTPTGC
jgi:DNA-binding NarL/FixJ family response regulator